MLELFSSTLRSNFKFLTVSLNKSCKEVGVALRQMFCGRWTGCRMWDTDRTPCESFCGRQTHPQFTVFSSKPGQNFFVWPSLLRYHLSLSGLGTCNITRILFIYVSTVLTPIFCWYKTPQFFVAKINHKISPVNPGSQATPQRSNHSGPKSTKVLWPKNVVTGTLPRTPRFWSQAVGYVWGGPLESLRWEKWEMS